MQINKILPIGSKIRVIKKNTKELGPNIGDVGIVIAHGSGNSRRFLVELKNFGQWWFADCKSYNRRDHHHNNECWCMLSDESRNWVPL